MRLSKLQEIRKRKRISREKLAKDLDLTKQYIKHLETEDCFDLDLNVLESIANYFKVEINDLIDDSYEGLDFNAWTKIKKLSIPEDSDPIEVHRLFNSLIKKYKILDSENIDTFISEFNYRVKEIDNHKKDKWKEFIKEMEDSDPIPHDPSDEDDSNKHITNEQIISELSRTPGLRYKEPLMPSKSTEIDIRQTAATAAIAYKELLAQGLSFAESIEIIRAILG